MVIFQYNLYIFGIRLWTVFYPKPCYKEPCYIEVVVYWDQHCKDSLFHLQQLSPFLDIYVIHFKVCHRPGFIFHYLEKSTPPFIKIYFPLLFQWEDEAGVFMLRSVFNMLYKHICRWHLKYFSYFCQKIGFNISCKLFLLWLQFA